MDIFLMLVLVGCFFISLVVCPAVIIVYLSGGG